jgi:hypothetical protein
MLATFVLACKYMSQSVITTNDLQIADTLMVKFCKAVERIYGKEFITPNMHLHLHLKQVIIDHGPIPSFWCFSFERFNGILGSIKTNNRSVELQLMRKLLTSRQIEEFNLPEQFNEEFTSLCFPVENEEIEQFNDTTINNWHLFYQYQNICTALHLDGIDWRNYSGITLSSSYKIIHFHSEDLNILTDVYKVMYPASEIQSNCLADIFHKFGSITIRNINFGSNMQNRGIRSSRILASWPDGQGHILKDSFSLSAGAVDFYFSHSSKINSVYVTHFFRMCELVHA